MPKTLICEKCGIGCRIADSIYEKLNIFEVSLCEQCAYQDGVLEPRHIAVYGSYNKEFADRKFGNEIN